MDASPAYAELESWTFFEEERCLQLFRRRLLAEDLESFLLPRARFLSLAERCIGPSDCLEGLFAALSGGIASDDSSAVDIAAFCSLVAIASTALTAEKVDFLLSCLDYGGTGSMSDGMWILSVKARTTSCALLGLREGS